MNKEPVDYNKAAVYYCNQCLSLKIIKNDDVEYCDDCGATFTKSTSIDKWEKLYEAKYGVKFLNKKRKNG